MSRTGRWCFSRKIWAFLRYCSLVISREVFFVSKGHRKPETYCANLCDQHKFCASRSVLLRTEWTVTFLQLFYLFCTIMWWQSVFFSDMLNKAGDEQGYDFRCWWIGCTDRIERSEKRSSQIYDKNLCNRYKCTDSGTVCNKKALSQREWNIWNTRK